MRLLMILTAVLVWSVTRPAAAQDNLQQLKQQIAALQQQLDAMEIGPKSFSYTVPVVDQNICIRKYCAKEWRFSYGVPEYTHKSVLSCRGKHGHKQKNPARKTEVGGC